MQLQLVHRFLTLLLYLIVQRLSLQDCAIEAERKWEEEEDGKLMRASLSPELFTETSLCVLVRCSTSCYFGSLK